MRSLSLRDGALGKSSVWSLRATQRLTKKTDTTVDTCRHNLTRSLDDADQQLHNHLVGTTRARQIAVDGGGGHEEKFQVAEEKNSVSNVPLIDSISDIFDSLDVAILEL